MTLSKANRTENLEQIFQTILAELGDRSLADYIVMEGQFPEALITTWDELRLRNWVRPVSDELPMYLVTGTGWIAGLELTGRLGDSQFRDAAFRLVAALKKRVRGRSDSAIATIADFNELQIPSGFVFNVIESGLLTVIDPNKDYRLEWTTTDPWNSGCPTFLIPRTLGQLRL
jgi:hypothetical protein